MTTLADLLAMKDPHVHTLGTGATVLEAIRLMNEERIGALVIMEKGRVAGIFTERDVLRRVVEDRRSPAALKVAEVMTTQVICCSPGTPIEEAGRLMKERRVRHLPVCDEAGRLMGLVSIGDVNAYHVHAHEATIHALQEYVYGR